MEQSAHTVDPCLLLCKLRYLTERQESRPTLEPQRDRSSPYLAGLCPWPQGHAPKGYVLMPLKFREPPVLLSKAAEQKRHPALVKTGQGHCDRGTTPVIGTDISEKAVEESFKTLHSHCEHE